MSFVHLAADDDHQKNDYNNPITLTDDDIEILHLE
jgi:hypothetical protein